MDPENRFTLDLEEIYKTHGPLIPSAPPLASPVSSPSSNDKGVATVEQTGPPTPKEGKVINFETVSKGIHRSSFPHPTNLEHLASLKLKTIVYVSTQSPIPPLSLCQFLFRSLFRPPLTSRILGVVEEKQETKIMQHSRRRTLRATNPSICRSK